VKPSRDGHAIRKYQLKLINDTNERITQYNGEIQVPSSILKHWSSHYPAEVTSDDPHKRCFQFNEEGRGVLNPHGQVIAFADDYCTTCANDDIPAVVAERTFEAKAWVNGREYAVSKSIKQLAIDAGR